MDSLSEEIEFSPGDHDSNPRAFQRTNVFGCSSPRMGLLAAGITELVSLEHTCINFFMVSGEIIVIY